MKHLDHPNIGNLPCGIFLHYLYILGVIKTVNGH